jgi:ABC-type transporter Mla MlaB component
LAAPEGSRRTSLHALRPPFEPRTMVLIIRGSIEHADLSGLCRRVRSLLEGSGASLVICDVGGLVEPDAVAVDALARLQVTAVRSGCRVRFRHASGRLRGLLHLMGLDDVLRSDEAACASWPSILEPQGQAEHREEALGVEEESDPADPSV